MTVPLKAARDVKISAKGAKAPLPWAARPITVGLALSLGAAAAGIFGAIEGLRAYTGSDPSPKRWSSVTETETGCYRDLISETPPLSDCVHSDAKAIDPRGFDWVAPHVAVYSAAAAPHSPPTLRDLGDQAQAQAVGFLEKDASVKGGAWATLENALSNSATGAGERDPFRFDRVLVANVAKGVDWRPGDRMMWTRVLVEPINFTFAGYSVASTENETQKIGSVEKTELAKVLCGPQFDNPRHRRAEGERWAEQRAHGQGEFRRQCAIREARDRHHAGFPQDHARKRDRRRRRREYRGVPDRRDRSRDDLETISQR